MTSQGSQPGDAAAVTAAHFRIQLRAGIWEVKLDEQIFGDFSGLNLAFEGIASRAGELQSMGREVHIIALSGRGAVLSKKVLPADEVALTR